MGRGPWETAAGGRRGVGPGRTRPGGGEGSGRGQGSGGRSKGGLPGCGSRTSLRPSTALRGRPGVIPLCDITTSKRMKPLTGGNAGKVTKSGRLRSAARVLGAAPVAQAAAGSVGGDLRVPGDEFGEAARKSCSAS